MPKPKPSGAGKSGCANRRRRACESKADAEAVESAKPKDADKPGIAGPDNTTLPYGLLEKAREDTLTLAAENERLKASLAKAAPQAPAVVDATAELLTQTRKSLDAVRENYGEDVAKPLEAILGIAETTNQELAAKDKQITAMHARMDGFDERARANGTNEAQRLIDQNPTLLKWQGEARAASGGDDTKSALAWEQAEALDNVLEKSVEWRGRPMAERFAHVVKVLGDDAPVSGSPETSPARDKTDADKVIADATKVKSDAAPTSLTDIPAAASPESQQESLEKISPGDLQAKILKGDISFDSLRDVVAGAT